MKRLTLAALGLIALAAVPASAADWSDTYLGYRVSTQFHEPANDKLIKKDIFSLGHVSGYSKGSNFFSVDMLKSDSNDPENNTATAVGSNRGAQEVYATYRHNLSFEKVFGKKFEFGPVRGVDFTAGFDYSAKNTTFAPSVFKLMAGPTFSFKVPGFLNVGVLYYKERNHNAFGGAFGAAANGGFSNVDFKATYQIAAAWGIPVALGKVNTSVKGFGTYTGVKGKDGAARDTKPELLTRIYWMADLSPVLGAKKGTWQIGPGFEYWHNKFGNATYESIAAAPAPSAVRVNPTTNAFQLAVEYHF